MTNVVMAGLGPATHEKPLHNRPQKGRVLFGIRSSLHPGVDARPKAGHDVLP